ncbi:hypothetical protein AVEN_146925-1 [Araneus ventricosus]|uniref:Uncharacterized protein n=1 Tax=Araneus ventricosus TaxID=182803 RepID=A0A4Y2NTZ8_ARAVE|nr:hypothetical protein AVEN_146925-1 [Araneus ventricosus]
MDKFAAWSSSRSSLKIESSLFLKLERSQRPEFYKSTQIYRETLCPTYANILPQRRRVENAESDHFVPPENWSNLSDVTAFEEFVQCDSELATCSLLTIGEMIANEKTSSDEEDNCTEKPLPIFQQALAGFNTMQEYLISSDLYDRIKMALSTVHTELFPVHYKKNPTI